MNQPKRKSSYNYTYFSTKMSKYWKTIIADINKNWDYYLLSFCEPDEKYWIKNIKDIDTKFSDLERCKIYAECFMLWYLYSVK